MTVREFNQSIEKFEIDVLTMPADERLECLVSLTKDRHELTGKVYNIVDLLVILEQLSGLYLHTALSRVICNLLYIYE